jgi:hypothetical protein
MYTPPPTDPIEFVDWYLEHGRTNLNYDLRVPRVWEFTLRTRNVDGMVSLGKALRKARYLTAEQESVVEVTYEPAAKASISQTTAKKAKKAAKARPKRKVVNGPPMVTAFWRGTPSASTLKRRVRSLIALAATVDATYSSLGSMDLDEFEMFYGPPKAMSLADACWRLRSHSDLGLKAGAKMKYTFCVDAVDVKACTAAMKKAGFAQIERAPKDANWTISVTVPAVNNERILKAEFATMKKASKAAGGTLKGVLL